MLLRETLSFFESDQIIDTFWLNKPFPLLIPFLGMNKISNFSHTNSYLIKMEAYYSSVVIIRSDGRNHSCLAK